MDGSRESSPKTCVVCDRPLDHAEWVLLAGDRFAVCDRRCSDLLTYDPTKVLGPRVELRFRKNCRRCRDVAAMWEEAARRRPLRLRLVDDESLSVEDCPVLLIENEPDEITGRITDLEELLSWLDLQYPGYGGCCWLCCPEPRIVWSQDFLPSFRLRCFRRLQELHLVEPRPDSFANPALRKTGRWPWQKNASSRTKPAGSRVRSDTTTLRAEVAPAQASPYATVPYRQNLEGDYGREEAARFYWRYGFPRCWHLPFGHSRTSIRRTSKRPPVSS